MAKKWEKLSREEQEEIKRKIKQQNEEEEAEWVQREWSKEHAKSNL